LKDRFFMDPVARGAEANDLEGVLALYKELRPDDPVLPPKVAREAFAALLGRKDADLVVCEVADTLVATCMLATIPNLASSARPIGVIEHVVTLAAHRNRGYARLVLEFALSKAWSRGCCKVMLLSGAQRKDAHHLYESVGFVGNVERGFVAKPTSEA
jgi:GNAT superfamily N-acetyltransferase